jgi:glycosyltransferase involved in cell wall biosynthesis
MYLKMDEIRSNKTEPDTGKKPRSNEGHEAAKPLVVVKTLPKIDLRLTSENGLHWELETPLPEALLLGGGNGLLLRGWCFHESQPIAGLGIRLLDREYPVQVHSDFREDVKARFAPEEKIAAYAAQSGFWAFLSLADEKEATTTVELVAETANGTRVVCDLGPLKLIRELPPMETVRLSIGGSKAEVPIVICMTSYNPPVALFRKQIESIRRQTHSNWICIISDDGSSSETLLEIRALLADDARFCLYSFSERLGFYGNFERCLRLVPAETQFICLADHDDEWYPEKISTLLAAFDPETQLAYSDMRVIDEDGKILSNTFWTSRKNNFSNLQELLLVNTITGAASMFRRSLLDHALPFPPQVGNFYHDHWIATLAMAQGRIRYIDRPLYDYVQHDANVIGHREIAVYPLVRTIYYLLRQLRNEPGRAQARDIYFKEVMRTCVLARMAGLRLGKKMEKKARKSFSRLAGLDESPLSFCWLILHGFRHPGKFTVTMQSEFFLATGILWKRLGRLQALYRAFRYKCFPGIASPQR